MSTDVPMKRCPRCKGRKDFDCPDCYGTGEVIDIAELEAALGRLQDELQMAKSQQRIWGAIGT